MALKVDRNLFSQMILVAESRSVNMNDVLADPLDPLRWDMKDDLAHPLGPLPWALANSDDPYQKQTKPHLPRSLRKNVSPGEAILTSSTGIIGGMGMVQRMNGNNKSFAQLAESIVSMVLYVGVQSGRVDVFDAYHQPSIKDYERLNRGAITTIQYKCLQGDTTYNSGENPV